MAPCRHCRAAARAARFGCPVCLDAIHPNSRVRKAAIRACWSSFCAAPSTAWRPWLRSAIPIGLACAATAPSCSTARRRRLPLDLLLCAQPGDAQSATGSTRPTRRPSCMPPRRPTGSVRISTARTCWRAASPSPASTDSGLAQSRALARIVRRRCRSSGRAAPWRSGRSRPLVVRGRAPVMSWAAAAGRAGQRRHAARGFCELYRHTDLSAGCCARRTHPPGRAGARRRQARRPRPRRNCRPPGIARARAYFAEAAGTAACYLARPEGPRVGAMGFVGWDTHVNEGAARRPAGRSAGRPRRARWPPSRPTWRRPGGRRWSR